MSLRFKRHYKLFVALTLLCAVSVLGFGSQRVVPYTVHDTDQLSAQLASYGHTLVLLYQTVVHDLHVLFA